MTSPTPKPRTVPTLYEMAPIGKDGALEAIHAHYYCSPECRDQDAAQYPAADLVDEPIDQCSYGPEACCDFCWRKLDTEP